MSLAQSVFPAARQSLSIAHITLLESARKQIFHVLMLVALTLIAVSTCLGIFDHAMLIKFVKDLCVLSIAATSTVIGITLASSGLPADIEARTLYPVLAKPVARWQYVVGKYLGALGAVALGMAIMLAAFCCILFLFTGHIDTGVFLVTPFLLIEVGIVTAIALALSTVCSPPLAWFLSLAFCLAGNAKFWLCATLASRIHGVLGSALVAAASQIIPNLECFNFKDSLVYGLPVPAAYLWQTALYGFAFTAFVLSIASFSFARREL